MAEEKLDLNKTLCLFHLISKIVLGLNYILKISQMSNSIFGIEFKQFICL